MMNTTLGLVFDNTTKRIKLVEQPDNFITWLTTALIISLCTDAQCDEEELPDDEKDRRGWWGDSDLPEGESLGNKQWLMKRRSMVPDTINKTRNYANQAVAWLVETGKLRAIIVASERINNDIVAYQIDCQLHNRDWVKILLEKRNDV